MRSEHSIKYIIKFFLSFFVVYIFMYVCIFSYVFRYDNLIVFYCGVCFFFPPFFSHLFVFWFPCFVGVNIFTKKFWIRVLNCHDDLCLPVQWCIYQISFLIWYMMLNMVLSIVHVAYTIWPSLRLLWVFGTLCWICFCHPVIVFILYNYVSIIL